MDPAIIDACCLIDLLVTGHADAILRANRYAWHLPAAVLAEVRYLRKYDSAKAGAFLNTPVDLTLHVASGLLIPCQPDDRQELARFVQYSTQFRSDGEAMCIALAECRGWPVATDDRKSIRVARQAGLRVISCPELIKSWVDAARPDAATLVQILADIQSLAQFRPNSAMPESAWWLKRLSSP